MRFSFICLLLLSIQAHGQKTNTKLSSTQLNRLAADYVRLGLSIGQYDADFVDAYYGPDSLKPKATKEVNFPKMYFLQQVSNLQAQLQPFITHTKEATLAKRAKWIHSQLTAYGRRIKMFAGEKSTFDLQAKELFGVKPPTYTEAHFQALVQQLADLLPGEGPVNSRFQTFANRFIISKEKLDTVIKATIAESKRRTLQNFSLPSSEDFRLEYVTGKSWSGYNWYQGNYKSLIQFNTDVTSFIDRIIDVASHEGYPGHHVYNSLLEQRLYKDSGWLEISLYPLFSPQSLIAEGSANYGVEVAFPPLEKMSFLTQTLFPLAGLDTTGLAAYFRALSIKGQLATVRTEVARSVIDGKMTDKEAVRWLMDYGLYNETDAARSLSFTKKYQSYVINYTYGMDLVKQYIENNGGTEKNLAKRWELFEWLLSHEVLPADLQGKPETK